MTQAAFSSLRGVAMAMSSPAVLFRFAVAGVLNTLVGLTVALTLDLGFHVAPALANAAGYAVGWTMNWALQRRFVFRSDARDWGAKARYVVTIVGAFALNQTVLWAAPMVLGTTPPERALSQLAAIATYTVTQFVVLRFWVFRRPTETPHANG